VDDKTPEWIIVDAHHVQLRAERLGSGDGRIYTITITCTNDTSKKSSTQTVTVLVPHDQGTTKSSKAKRPIKAITGRARAYA
jgi:hypothetical protein